MENWVIKEFLQQLQKVYVHSELQYADAALRTDSDILRIFFELQAYDRLKFVEDIQRDLDRLSKLAGMRRTLGQLYKWHKNLYGESAFTKWSVTDINLLPIDERALEICNSIVKDSPSEETISILKKHASKIESTLLSMAYLRALYG